MLQNPELSPRQRNRKTSDITGNFILDPSLVLFTWSFTVNFLLDPTEIICQKVTYRQVTYSVDLNTWHPNIYFSWIFDFLMPSIQMLYPFNYQSQAGVQWGLRIPNIEILNTLQIQIPRWNFDVFYEVFVNWPKIGLELSNSGQKFGCFCHVTKPGWQPIKS